MNKLDVVGLVVILASSLASGVNEGIRNGGGAPSRGMAIFQAVLNVLALNIDKTKQAIKSIKSANGT